MLQVVETNLVAFDCHWILINEVSPTDMIHASRCVFMRLYFDLDKDPGPELFVLCSKENAILIFPPGSPFGVISCPTTYIVKRTFCVASVGKKKDLIHVHKSFLMHILKNIALENFGELLASSKYR